MRESRNDYAVLSQLVHSGHVVVRQRGARFRRERAVSLSGSSGWATVLALWWEDMPIAGDAHVRPHSKARGKA